MISLLYIFFIDRILLKLIIPFEKILPNQLDELIKDYILQQDCVQIENIDINTELVKIKNQIKQKEIYVVYSELYQTFYLKNNLYFK